MPEVVLVATFEAVSGCGEELGGRLQEMVALTRGEDGCARYDLHVDRGNDERLVFVETWADEASWQRHMETDHVRALLADAPRLTVTGVRLQQLSPL